MPYCEHERDSRRSKRKEKMRGERMGEEGETLEREGMTREGREIEEEDILSFSNLNSSLMDKSTNIGETKEYIRTYKIYMAIHAISCL